MVTCAKKHHSSYLVEEHDRKDCVVQGSGFPVVETMIRVWSRHIHWGHTWITWLGADTYVNPGTLLSKMFTCALLFARTITPVVCMQHNETTHCKNNATQCTHHQNRTSNLVNDCFIWYSTMTPILACTSVYQPLGGGAALFSTGFPISWICELMFHFLLDRLSATTTQPDFLFSSVMTNHSCLFSAWPMTYRGASPVLIWAVTCPMISPV